MSFGPSPITNRFSGSQPTPRDQLPPGSTPMVGGSLVAPSGETLQFNQIPSAGDKEKAAWVIGILLGAGALMVWLTMSRLQAAKIASLKDLGGQIALGLGVPSFILLTAATIAAWKRYHPPQAAIDPVISSSPIVTVSSAPTASVNSGSAPTAPLPSSPIVTVSSAPTASVNSGSAPTAPLPSSPIVTVSSAPTVSAKNDPLFGFLVATADAVKKAGEKKEALTSFEMRSVLRALQNDPHSAPENYVKRREILWNLVSAMSSDNRFALGKALGHQNYLDPEESERNALFCQQTIPMLSPWVLSELANGLIEAALNSPSEPASKALISKLFLLVREADAEPFRQILSDRWEAIKTNDLAPSAENGFERSGGRQNDHICEAFEAAKQGRLQLFPAPQ